MQMSGTRILPASKQDVWDKLNDVAVLKRCIPGCQELEQVGENQLKATVGLKIGPINAKFQGDVELSNMNPPNSYRISGSGKGGPAGGASGGADVALADTDGGTELTYNVDARVTGKIAQLGARLIDATANSLANKFFDNLAEQFDPPPETATATGAEPQGRRPQQSLTSHIWWIAGAVIVVIVAVYALGLI